MNTVMLPSNAWAPQLWSHYDPVSESLPKITIGILSYNRKDDLRRTIDCITNGISYPNLEIIVVDNASQDGSPEMIRSEFPSVRLFALKTNTGTSGRNLFYQQAAGKYVFSFDDDSFPATPATIMNAVGFLETRPDVHSLTFLYYQPLTAFEETGQTEYFRLYGSAEQGYTGLFFAEGGMCFRTASFLETEGYEKDFVCYGEGLELALQFYKLGLKMMYHTGLATLHMKSPTNRRPSNMRYLITRNHIWAFAKHFPWYGLIAVLLLFFLRQIVSMILHPQYVRTYIRGIKDGILGISTQRRRTTKLTLRQVLGLKRWYLFLLRW